MNKIRVFLLLLALSIPLWGDSQPYVKYGKYTPGQVVILFADKVNVRNAPDPKARIMDRLPIGSRLQILEESAQAYTFNGYTESWYKVKYPCTCGKKIDEGYIWGGMLSKAVIIKKNGDRAVPQAILIGAVGKSNDSTIMEARYIDDMTIRSSVLFKGLDMSFNQSFSYSLSARALPRSWFKKELELVLVDFVYEACEYPMGEVLLVLDGDQIRYGFSSYRAFSEFGKADFRYIWPRDKEGKKDTVIVESISIDYEAATTNTSREEYLWQQGKFKKIGE